MAGSRRLNLTAWLGMGPAFVALSSDEKKMIGDMYTTWPWFNALVDVVDMVLAKSEEAGISANYDEQLVATLDRPDVEELLGLGASLRQELGVIQQEILRLRGYSVPQQENDILTRGLQVRNPYVDSLNVLQVEVLKRLRAGDTDPEERALLEDALAISINGIANGQKNTG